MANIKTQFIKFAIKANILKFGSFTLKSGRVSPYFFNAGAFNTGMLLAKLGEFYAATLDTARTVNFDMLFGPAYKGIPLAATTAIALNNEFHRNIPYAYNRKEAKAHGEGGLLVGAPLEGRVLVIDDVITAGTAKREAIKTIEDAGATFAGIIIALDRQEKGESGVSAIQEIEQTHQVPVLSIINLQDIVDYLEAQSERDDDLLASIADYREQYGTSVTTMGE